MSDEKDEVSIEGLPVPPGMESVTEDSSVEDSEVESVDGDDDVTVDGEDSDSGDSSDEVEPVLAFAGPEVVWDIVFDSEASSPLLVLTDPSTGLSAVAVVAREDVKKLRKLALGVERYYSLQKRLWRRWVDWFQVRPVAAVATGVIIAFITINLIIGAFR